MSRQLVFVSGYYGFDNLGDEAILEEICNELKELTSPENIVVLSATPEQTAKKYGVSAIQRKNFGEYWTSLVQTRLLVSGGGGLFQNTKSLGSIFFYGLHILMAKANQVKIVVYAQGIGPLRGNLAENICKQVFSQADDILVRDDTSMRYLQAWNINARKSADPVWNLKESLVPAEVAAQLSRMGASKTDSKCIGVSLRPSAELTDSHLEHLADAMNAEMKADELALLLPMQRDQDIEVLKKFAEFLKARGRNSEILDTSQLVLPSQWLGVFAHLKALVGMRLHAIIMALKAGKPVAGIGYDPKVTQLLAEFEQCCLILTKESGGKEWPNMLKTFAGNMNSYASKVNIHLEAAKKLSCQNFEALARILNMPSDK